MAWKEHVAWLSPILATVVAFIVVYYGDQLIRHQPRTAMVQFVLAFAVAAGAFGAFITKVEPNRRARSPPPSSPPESARPRSAW